MSRSPRSAIRIAVALLPSLGGCGEVPSVTDPPALAARACAIAPADIGAPRMLSPGTSCVTLGVDPASYAVAFFDGRYVDAARSSPESLAPERDTFFVTVRAGTNVGAPPAPSRAPLEPRRIGPDRAVGLDGGREGDGVVRLSRAASGGGACADAPGAGIFCRPGPWSVGDTLTLPAAFGRFTGGKPRPVKVFATRGPFVFTVTRSLREPERLRLSPVLESLGKVGVLRILPLLERSLLDRPVYTSAGAQQLVVDVVFDQVAVCVCGVAVGDVIEGVGVAGVSLRFPEGARFAADRVGLFAHELAHVWQLAYEADRAPDGGTPATAWALEGGADLVRQEILRDLSLQPLAGNRDASVPPTNVYLDRLYRNLRAANGRIRAGYGQTAGFLRHLFLEATRAGALYEPALSAVLRGALEGWYRSADPATGGAGLEGRMGAILDGFDPAEAVLAYALANAADDRTENDGLQNHSVLESWRESEGSTFVPAAEIRGAGGVTVSREAGSVGYVYVTNEGGPTSLSLETDIPEMRWMVVRFE